MSTTSRSPGIEAGGGEISGKAPGPRFPVLDTIRGLAFLLVVFSHIGNARNLPTRGLGQFGVWIFFVLSAFLLSYPFFSQPSTIGRLRGLGVYFIRRFLRIIPPLALALLAFHLWRGWGWEMVWRNLACLQGNGILWTVFNETRYYLLLPVMVAVVAFLWERPGLMVAVLLVALWLHLLDAPFWKDPKLWFAGLGRPGLQGVHSFFQYLPLFVSGTLLARLHVAVSRSETWDSRLRRIAPACTILWFTGVALLSPAAVGLISGVPVPLYYYHCWWVPMIPLTAGLIFFPLFVSGPLHRFLAHPGCRCFGAISYSGYLWHIIFVERFAAMAGDGWFAIAVFGATCAVATLAYFLVERPLVAWGHSLGRT